MDFHLACLISRWHIPWIITLSATLNHYHLPNIINPFTHPTPSIGPFRKDWLSHSSSFFRSISARIFFNLDGRYREVRNGRMETADLRFETIWNDLSTCLYIYIILICKNPSAEKKQTHMNKHISSVHIFSATERAVLVKFRNHFFCNLFPLWPSTTYETVEIGGCCGVCRHKKLQGGKSAIHGHL